MRELQFEIILKKIDEGRYQAVCPSLPGCFSEGKTKKEALLKIEKAILDYIEMALDWTASGLTLLKIFSENEKNKEKNNKSPLIFSMEVQLFAEEVFLNKSSSPFEKGILGIPFGIN